MHNNKKGTFIVFEGIDGSGKSTQLRLLADRLQETGTAYYTTMEPTDSPVGSLIHQVMTGRMQADPKVIAALFVADRLDHLLNTVNGIVRKVEEGTVVIMDRYYFSSYAYQSVDVSMDWLIQANALSRSILQPDIHIFIDIDPELAMERITKNRFEKELFEEKSRLIQVRKKYLEAFDRFRDTEQVIRIDGNRKQEEVAQDVWEAVQECIHVQTGTAAVGKKEL